MIEYLDITAPAEEKTDCKKIFDTSYVDLSEYIPRQPVALSIGETSFGGNTFPIPFGTYGNYSCIVAPSKSKKSFFKSALLAAYIGGNAVNYFPNIRGHRSEDSIIIDIDTEQSKYDAQKVFRRTAKMSGGNYAHYYAHALRPYTPNQRLEFIDWLVYKWEHRDRIGLISIDGYADLINNFNDIEQSNNLITKLMQWTDDRQCHITGILHSNFDSDKPVGHIGSAVLKKSETVVYLKNQIDPDGSDTVNVNADKYSRNKPFDSFDFFINDQWLPEVKQKEVPF